MNGRSFFKTKYCKIIDDKLGGLYLEIRTRELHLLGAFVEHLRPVYDYWLETIGQVYDQFDVLTGFAYCAAQYHWVKPIFVQKPVAHIERGSHPLVEHILDTNLRESAGFVPNDTFIGGTHAPIQVITGANSSGKSVYLKQVGLLHFLAHIGSFVPAQSCRLGLTDMIFSRIRTLESASVQLSAFEIDICQISSTLRSATENSLVLVDEFGKGTRPDDGAALLASCILHLADRKPVPPRAILTTHYPEIFTLKLVAHPLVQCYFMGTEKGEKKGSGTRCLEYRYTLHPGVCVRSFGIECAELAGIPSDILSRAIEIYNHLEHGDGIPTFEVKALRLLQAFDWKMGDKMTLIRRIRSILQGKCEAVSSVSRVDVTPPPVTMPSNALADEKVETPPEYRNGLDPRGSSFHCTTDSISDSDNPLKRLHVAQNADAPKRHCEEFDDSPLLPHAYPHSPMWEHSQDENLSPRARLLEPVSDIDRHPLSPRPRERAPHYDYRSPLEFCNGPIDHMRSAYPLHRSYRSREDPQLDFAFPRQSPRMRDCDGYRSREYRSPEIVYRNREHAIPNYWRDRECRDDSYRWHGRRHPSYGLGTGYTEERRY